MNTSLGGISKSVEQLITSYESQVWTVAAIIDGSHSLVGAFRKERLEANDRLRWSLARNASLRRKDFDGMMRDFNLCEEEREEKVRSKIDTFLKQQRELVSELRALLQAVNADDMGNIRARMRDIQRRQNEATREVSEAIRSFEREHEQFVTEAHRILSNTTSLSMTDFKDWLRQLHNNAHNSRGGKALDAATE